MYIKGRAASKIPVGKRLFCANRCGRAGCGATLCLRLCTRVPGLHATADVMQSFLDGVENGLGVELAYAKTTAPVCESEAELCVSGQNRSLIAPRNAWRWLKKLHRHLPRFRALLPGPDAACAARFAHRSARLRLLLPTFALLKTLLGQAFISAFQMAQQRGFLL